MCKQQNRNSHKCCTGFLVFRAQKSAINAAVQPPRNLCQNSNKCCCTDLEIHAKRQQKLAVRNLPRFPCNGTPLAIRPASEFVPNQIAPLMPRNLCKFAVRPAVRPSFLKNRAKNLPHCVLNLLYGLAEMLPWNVCQAVASFSSLPRNLPCSLALLLSICSWKNEWPFPPFPPLT